LCRTCSGTWREMSCLMCVIRRAGTDATASYTVLEDVGTASRAMMGDASCVLSAACHGTVVT
jgi:hypothetical protein